MATVLREFPVELFASDGRTWTARACGRQCADGRWEGWLEFLPRGPGAVLRSQRETVQPNLHDLEYWAAGLRAVFLEGSLARTLAAAEPRLAPHPPRPVFDAPAPRPGPGVAPPLGAVPLLDPFRTFEVDGDAGLERRLAVLPRELLVEIVVRHGIAAPEALAGLGHEALIAHIVTAARARAASP